MNRQPLVFESWLIGFATGFALGAGLMLSTGCRPNPPAHLGLGSLAYWRTGMPAWTNYPVTVTRKTPSGVSVDDPKGELSDAVIDEAFASVESCLKRMPERWSVEQANINRGGCHRFDVPLAIDRRGLIVKVAPDWYTSKCSGEQLFPCKGIGNAGCLAKGLDVTRECPCNCRHAIQWDVVLIVPPSAKLLKAAIAKAVTACENPWALPLKECVE